MPTPLQSQRPGMTPVCHPYHLTLFVFFLVACMSAMGCKSIVPPEKFEFVVRDGSNLTLLDSATIRITKDGNQLTELTTDAKGYAVQSARNANLTENFLYINPEGYQLKWSKNFGTSSNPDIVSDSVLLNRYMPLYELYLLPTGTKSISIGPNPEPPTADMHYHVSMRTHNHFGKWLYMYVNPIEAEIPENLNWYKSYKKLRVLYTSPRGKTEVKSINPGDLARKNDKKLQSILEQKWVYAPVGASNKFTQFTQATHPHVAEGNVRLAYNAISPFERSTSHSGSNRFANKLFVTGANTDWLKRIGAKAYPMTHWENFNFEYYNITRQSTSYNHFTYRFFDHQTDLSDDIPTIVTVLEGSHVLQHKFFPQIINFNIGKASFDNSIVILKYQLDQRFPKYYLPTERELDSVKMKFIADSIISNSFPLRSKAPRKHAFYSDKIEVVKPLAERVYSDRNLRNYLAPGILEAYLDRKLKDELIQNIDSLKRMVPPICMITVSHLAYNGMTGHSVAWDQGRGISNLIARRNYGIRVSDDESYKRQWQRNFYSIPGINQYGKLVMDSLISRTNGHRIMIDLKHADPSTRRYFMDSIMVQKSIAPICSHCGVNGLSIKFASPLINEYYLAKAQFVKTLYPFGINLYDEEIQRICNNGGIIGIPLEQRILGGYINKRAARSYFINKWGKYIPDINRKNKRWTYTKRYFRHLLVTHDPSLVDAVDYVRNRMGIMELDHDSLLVRYTHILDIITKDYMSAEPFLYNVFHVVDQCGLASTQQAWKHICIGSDLDGLIDPIDMMPTASQYPQFKEKLQLYIPIFLELRRLMDPEKRGYESYFNDQFTIQDALDLLFYESLYMFTRDNMLK